MSSQSTKETLLSLDKAEFLGKSTRTQKPTVSPALTEVFSVLPPQGEGQGPLTPDWDVVQESNIELLEHASREARETSQAYRLNKVKVVNLHRRRDSEAKGLRQRLRSLRARFEGTYVKDVLGLVGLDDPPARRFTAVREQCLDFVGRARDPEVAEKLGDTLPGSSPLDLEELAREMSDAVRVFDDTLDDVTEAKKVRDESLVVRNEAQERHNRVYVNVARIHEGYYRLAGLDDLADRIRITIPVRSSKSDEPTPDPSEPSPDSDDAEVPDHGP